MGTGTDSLPRSAPRRAVVALACTCLVVPPLPAQDTDSLALVALYKATSGQSWTNNAGWLVGPLAPGTA